MSKEVIIFVGPSTSGKTTLAEAIVNKNPYAFEKIITSTTRSPRGNEIDGVDYYFLEKVSFLNNLAYNNFIEYNLFGGNYYGLSKSAINSVLLKNKSGIVILDPNGVKSVKSYLDENKIRSKIVFVDVKPDMVVQRAITRIKEDVNKGIELKGSIDKHVNRINNYFTNEYQWKDLVDYDVCVLSRDYGDMKNLYSMIINNEFKLNEQSDLSSLKFKYDSELLEPLKKKIALSLQKNETFDIDKLVSLAK